MIVDVNGVVAAGCGASNDRAEPEEIADVAVDPASSERDTMLVFRAGSEHPKAVPLSLVARIEDIPVATIEWAEDRPVVQYRGDVMPIVSVDSRGLRLEGKQPLLVFSDGGRSVGLAVDEVIDIVEDAIEIRLSGEVGGRLGTAVIAGKVTELLDVGYYLTLGLRQADRPIATPLARSARASILVIDDSAFFRNMLRPLLTAAGYEVTTAASAEEALRLRDTGRRFDLILSDVEMPGLSGIELARTVRTGGDWSETPMIALSSLASDQAQAAGLEAGFDEYVAKFDRLSLLSLLEQQLSRVAA